jgi:ribosome-binding protein aMBF1 (putative translation factor)
MILNRKICTVKPKSKNKSTKPLPKEETLKRLGERIKQLRIEKGYTSYEYFAYEHNISRAQFGRYERGEDLRFSSLLKVINALDISLEEFFGEDF